jgi:cation diffusion facilitator family transporter
MSKNASRKKFSATTQAVRAIVGALAVNLSLALLKGFAGVVGHSYALIADAMESLLDIFKGIVVLGGLHIADTEPDECHPYGHGKAEPLAAIIVATAILGAATGLAFESIHQINDPNQVAPAPWTLAVLIVVILCKFVLYRRSSEIGHAVASTSVHADAWDHFSDGITSTAVFVGVSIAIFCGEGYEQADDWAALVACAIIGTNGVRLLRPALAEVMDAAPHPLVEQKVRDTALAVKGVSDLDICRARKMGLYFYVDLHVWVDGDMSVRDGHEVAHQVKDRVREAEPRIRDVMIHIEPDDIESLTAT